MPHPCKECPFSRRFDGRYDSGGLVLFIGAVCEDEGQLCHLGPDEPGVECEGARRFFEGGDELAYGDLRELAAARARDELAGEFFGQMLRLMESEG
jgi:hypothetical protein